MLSIIIPALNEEDVLPRLLGSIKKQSFNDYEIIVADGGSEDKTAEIAENYGCKVVLGGSPAAGRNAGAKVANGELVMFLDADCLLPPPDFLEKITNEFKERKLDLATCFMKPLGKSKIAKINYELGNFQALLLERIFQQGTGLILIKKFLHQKIGGFDEGIKIGEDHEYLRRAAKKGRFRVLRSRKFFFSERRFEEEGWFKTHFKYFLVNLHVLMIGSVKTDIFKYKFGHYKDGKKS